MAGPELVPVSEFRRWSASAAFPQVPSRAAFRVWRKMKQHPRFDGSDLPRAEPSRAEPSRAEPSRAEPSRTEPNRTEPNRTEPNRTEPNRTHKFIAAGSSGPFKGISTPRTTATGSSATTDVALPASGGASRDARPEPVLERRWHFRPVRELDATGDRDRFVNDDGATALDERRDDP